MSDSESLLRIAESLGALRADMQNMKDDQEIERRTGAEFRREVRTEIATVKEGVTDVRRAIGPVVDAVDQHKAALKDHAKELEKNRLFRDRIGAVIAVGATGVSTVFGGVSYLVWSYSAEIWDFVRRLFTRS